MITGIQNYPFTNTISDRVMEVVPYALISAVAWTIFHGAAIAVIFPEPFAACLLVGFAGTIITAIVMQVFKVQSVMDILQFESGQMAMMHMVESPLRFCQGIVEFSIPILTLGAGVFSLIYTVPLLLSPPAIPILTISWTALGILAGGVKYLDSMQKNSTTHGEEIFGAARKITAINSITEPLFAIMTIGLVTLATAAFLAEAPITLPASLFVISGVGFGALQGLEKTLDEKGWIGKYSATSFVLNSLLSWNAMVGGGVLLAHTIPFLTPMTFFASLGGVGSLFLITKVALNALKSNSTPFEWLYRRANWGSHEARIEIFSEYGKKIVRAFAAVSNQESVILDQMDAWLRESASRGNASTMYQLGKYLLYGKHGFLQDAHYGLKLLNICAKSDRPNREKPLYQLAKYLFATSRKKLAMDYLIAAVEHGSKKALSFLGKKCFDNEQDGPTFLRMLKVLMDAAEKNSEIALYYLGKYCLYHPDHQNLGLKYLQKSMEMGFKDALNVLAFYYVCVDEEELVHLLLDKYGTNLKAYLYEQGTDHMNSPGLEAYGLKIFHCIAFRKNCVIEGIDARKRLYDYWFGLMTEEGDKKGVELLLKGVEVGCIYSKYRLGKYYIVI